MKPIVGSALRATVGGPGGAMYASGDGPWLGHLERMADRAYAA